MSNIVCNVGCPSCLSRGRDRTLGHLAVFADGGAYCIKGDECGYKEPKGSRDAKGQPIESGEGDTKGATGSMPQRPAQKVPSMAARGPSVEDISGYRSTAISGRRLQQPFVEMFGIKTEVDESSGQPAAYYFPVHSGGKVTGYKRRPADSKDFRIVGTGKDADIFGQHLPGGHRMVILTEGEFDAVAVKQALAADGTDWRVASLPNGASSTLSESAFQWLSSFESIKLCLDNDEAGDRAADEFAAMFPGKVQRVVLPCKDANECLMEGKGGDIKGCISAARPASLGGIVDPSLDYKQYVTGFLSEEACGIPYPAPLEALNEVTVGMQTGRLDVIGAGVGSGKSSLLRTLIYSLTQEHQQGVGVLSFEETVQETLVGQLSIAAEKPLHHPAVRKTLDPEYLEKLGEKVFSNGKLFVIDHTSENGIGDLYSKIRFMRLAYGVKYFFIDPLGLAVKGIESQETDGDAQIAACMRNLTGLCKSLDIYVGIVSHGRKSSSSGVRFGRTFERGGTMDLDDLLGSSSIKQVCHQALIMSRDQGHPDPLMRKTVLLTIRKNRAMAITGPACTYAYDEETGLLVDSPITPEEWAANLSADAPTAPKLTNNTKR